MKGAKIMERFCKWIRYDLDDIDFILNLVIAIRTNGLWIYFMGLYYWLFKRKEQK